MELVDLERKLGIEGLSDADKLEIVSSIQQSVNERRVQQKKQDVAEHTKLVIQAIRKIEADLKDRFDEMNGQIKDKVSSLKDGQSGRDGKDGKPGRDGKDGASVKGDRGADGKPGQDGQDGVSVVDAKIDFDGSLTITLSNGRQINAGEVVPMDIADRIKVITNGGGTSQYVLDAIADLQTQISAIQGGLNYRGTWNASTNTPTLTSSTGTSNYYYVVSVSGSTNLNGITDWVAGDWAIYNGSTWQKIDQTNSVTSVNAQTGAVVLGYADVGAFPATPTSGANSVVLRDANQNISVNSISEGYINVAAAGTTTVLTVASAPNYVVTGSGGQTYQLPNATTLPNGVNFTFNNNQSSGAITVNNNSGTLIVSVPSGAFVDVSLLSNAIAAGSWDTHFQAPSNVSWSTNTFSYGGSITNATWNGNTIAINRGGTNGTATPTAGAIAYGTGTAYGFTGAGTSGQVLTSAGAGTPTWSTPTTGTVTSVATTGTVNGITLTGGSITSSGTITLGGTLDLSSPPAIGGTTAAAGTFTTLIGGGGSANYEQITGGATGKAVQFQSLGSDAAVSLAIQPKGTGAIDLAAGSSGVNISNGGTVTAITRTAGGTGYTVAPTITISAPTTAGGVQATATCTVTAGVVDTTFTITNAGSGYVEQPTITFTPVSGGSGAAAYASVGATVVLKALNTFNIGTSAGTHLQLLEGGGSTVNFLRTQGAASGGAVYVGAAGADASVNTILYSRGTGFITLATNSGTEQARISHTASAVNYVQFTGGVAGTPGTVTISSAGSSANVDISLAPKGTGVVKTTSNAYVGSNLYIAP